MGSVPPPCPKTPQEVERLAEEFKAEHGRWPSPGELVARDLDFQQHLRSGRRFRLVGAWLMLASLLGWLVWCMWLAYTIL